MNIERYAVIKKPFDKVNSEVVAVVNSYPDAEKIAQDELRKIWKAEPCADTFGAPGSWLVRLWVDSVRAISLEILRIPVCLTSSELHAANDLIRKQNIEQDVATNLCRLLDVDPESNGKDALMAIAGDSDAAILFKHNYGFELKELLENWDCFVTNAIHCWDKGFDANVAENDAWEIILPDVLDRMAALSDMEREKALD